MKQYPLFITLEGIDGAGKTTLLTQLAQWLTSLEYDVVTTKEPGGTDFGKTLRALLQTQPCGSHRSEFLLFAADRAHHVETVIRPALLRGAIVLCDRYIDSSVAYQAYGLQENIEVISSINSWATQGLIPDCTLYLRVDHQTSHKRVTQRGAKSVIEQRDQDYWNNVITGFETLARQHDRIWTLDATQEIEDSYTEAKTIISTLLRHDNTSSPLIRRRVCSTTGHSS